MKKYIILFLVLLIAVQVVDGTSAVYNQEMFLTSGAIEANVTPPTPDPDPTPEPEFGYYPGTTIKIIASPWPQPEDYIDNEWKKITVPPSGIFWDPISNAFYVVARENSYNKNQASNGPGGVANNWFATEKLTGRILVREDFTINGDTINTMQRGDLYFDKVNNAYYVFNEGGSWSQPPDLAPSKWHQIPQDTIDPPLT